VSGIKGGRVRETARWTALDGFAWEHYSVGEGCGSSRVTWLWLHYGEWLSMGECERVVDEVLLRATSHQRRQEECRLSWCSISGGQLIGRNKTCCFT
jgi:hypothetical protein